LLNNINPFWTVRGPLLALSGPKLIATLTSALGV
jgi:hypothetical protein